MTNLINIEKRFVFDHIFSLTEINHMSYVDFMLYTNMLIERDHEIEQARNQETYDPITGERTIQVDQDLSQYGQNIKDANERFKNQFR